VEPKSLKLNLVHLSFKIRDMAATLLIMLLKINLPNLKFSAVCLRNLGEGLGPLVHATADGRPLTDWMPFMSQTTVSQHRSNKFPDVDFPKPAEQGQKQRAS